MGQLDRTLRGLLLDTLMMLGGESNHLILLAALRERGALINRARLHLLAAWLEAAGYLVIRRINPPGLNVEVIVYQLTPKGIDFVRGLIEDPDVERIG